MGRKRPRTLGRYEIQRELGRGTMGIVYEAKDPMLHRKVALKAIRIALSIPDELRELFEKRFLAEARAVAVLSHPGIVVVHDVGTDEKTETPYIAMEFLEGKTLEVVTAGGKRLQWREALGLAADAAWALHHAHDRGIVHRDIKPANIMRMPSGEPKIMDFGLARLPASELTAAGDLFGTPSYMSPEQAVGAVADARSDIFSLGCVLYQLLSGKKAFDGDSLPLILLRVREETPPPPSKWVDGLPPEVDAVVARALAKNADERYQDARAFAEDLEDVVEGKPPGHTEVLPVLDLESTVASRPAATPAAARPRATPTPSSA
ncbi:MAG: serine/threonine-protein kinase, partial [Vicinamibacteria bacterium]